uniref:Uncharacterized protein n=1 Tax=Tetraselmis sp. GSL018 TaxID=582737 RepID=A0A061SBW6_9CHLO
MLPSPSFLLPMDSLKAQALLKRTGELG